MTKEELEILFEEAFNNAQNVYFQNPQDIRNAFKLNAWMQVKHLSIEEAMEKYIEIINNLMKERNI